MSVVIFLPPESSSGSLPVPPNLLLHHGSWDLTPHTSRFASTAGLPLFLPIYSHPLLSDYQHNSEFSNPLSHKPFQINLQSVGGPLLNPSSNLFHLHLMPVWFHILLHSPSFRLLIHTSNHSVRENIEEPRRHYIPMSQLPPHFKILPQSPRSTSDTP